MKKCFKCNIEKPIDELYKHNRMADGHLGKCIDCAKKDVADRTAKMLLDPEWAAAERARCRAKQQRYRLAGTDSKTSKVAVADIFTNLFTPQMTATETICYEVKDWGKHFENGESRRYRSLAWVPVKNKHDGKGYRRVVQHPKSVQVFCAWNLIVQVASKMPTRGLLLDEDGPLTTSDLSMKTGFPESIFEVAFEVLIDPKIGWIVIHSRRPAQMPADARQNPVNRTEQNRTELQEWEGSPAPELPSEEEAFKMTMTVGLPMDFCRYVYQDWLSRAGKDAGGVVVQYLPYVTKRWVREQNEWKAKTHKGNSQNANHGKTAPDRNAGTYNAKRVNEPVSSKIR